MAEYVLTTDSNSDVPAEFLREYEIPVIPQYYMFGETVYGDELNMEPREFYETMRKGELPKSMANNPEVIREKFEKILKEGKDILHVAFSSALSGSCGNVQVVARDLAEEYPDRKIRVFDSLNASLGEGVSVMRAALLRREGKGMEEVLKVLEEERDHVNVWFTVDDLHHLQRGGRVSKTTAVVGRKKALKTLVTKMEESLDLERFGKDRTVAVIHGDCLEDAKLVAGQAEELGFTNVVINDVSPSIGTHAGPGVVGLVFYGKKVK